MPSIIKNTRVWYKHHKLIETIEILEKCIVNKRTSSPLDISEIMRNLGESVKVFTSQGNVLTGWPKQIPGSDTLRLYGYPAIGYIEGSDKRQVVVYASHKDGEAHKSRVLVYDYDGDLLYNFAASDFSTGSGTGAAISDVNADGNDEIIVSYEYHRRQGAVMIDSGFTEIFNKNGHVRTLEWGSGWQTSALVDLDSPGDGYPEMITGSVTDTLWAYKERTQDTLWKKNTGHEINSSPAVGDIGNITGKEVTFGNDDSKIWLKRCSNGNNLILWPYSTDGPVQTSAALARLEGPFDFYADIVIAANDMWVYGLNYSRNDISPYPLPLFGKASSPVIGDIDGDYKSETVIASADGYLHVWENVNSNCARNFLEWPQYHHDYQRTGLYGWTGGFSGGDSNPRSFSNATTITFSLLNTDHITVTIYDTEGNAVKTLINQTLAAGTYHPVWYGNNNNLESLPNGIYYIVLKLRNEQKVIQVEIAR